jgi:hypothetical protein
MDRVLVPDNIKLLYNTFKTKKKERFDIILEPLQCILQLALLRFCPIGTKVTINNNLLELQLPSYTQGIVRWYNNDNKDDLSYLFNACKRFSIFYKHLKEHKLLFNINDEILETNLYDVLIECSKEGINKLIDTYSRIDKVSILHTLQLYKLILENETIGLPNENNDNIDNIFININNIYSDEEIHIIHNTLQILLRNENESNNISIERNNYIYGLNTLLIPTFSKIKKWISDHIIF